MLNFLFRKKYNVGLGGAIVNKVSFFTIPRSCPRVGK
jgi:hypothetical protein